MMELLKKIQQEALNEEEKDDKSGDEEEDLKYKDDPLKRKRKKKGRKKKGEKNDEDTDYEVDLEKRMNESKIYQNQQIPNELKSKYAEIDANPFKYICFNLTNNITTDGIKEYFNTLIGDLKPELRRTQPVTSVEPGLNRAWVIMEFSSREAKESIKPFKDQLEFNGTKIRLMRPSEFFEKQLDRMKESDPQKLLEQDHKIYMGGLPPYLTEEDVRKLCESFGQLKYFNLVRDNVNGQMVSKGYCFFEYELPQVSDKAIKCLNGLQIGDRKIKVQKASTGTKQLSNLQTSSNKAHLMPSNYAGSFLASYEFIRDPNVIEMLNIPPSASIPSKVIQLMNMFTLEDLFEDDFYNDLMLDVKEEADKYGSVDRIEIPRPDIQTGYTSPACGKVFIKYKYQIHGKKARHNMAGRTYQGRTVIASFYPEESFNMRDFLIYG